MLDAISVRQDGTTAGATTIARKRSVFANVVAYAIELEELTANPLDRLSSDTDSAHGERGLKHRAVTRPAACRSRPSWWRS